MPHQVRNAKLALIAGIPGPRAPHRQQPSLEARACSGFSTVRFELEMSPAAKSNSTRRFSAGKKGLFLLGRSRWASIRVIAAAGPACQAEDEIRSGQAIVFYPLKSTEGTRDFAPKGGKKKKRRMYLTAALAGSCPRPGEPAEGGKR
ncbi:hypothetical protein MRX96_010383 [Rhipicephalus microplus]